MLGYIEIAFATAFGVIWFLLPAIQRRLFKAQFRRLDVLIFALGLIALCELLSRLIWTRTHYLTGSQQPIAAYYWLSHTWIVLQAAEWTKIVGFWLFIMAAAQKGTWHFVLWLFIIYHICVLGFWWYLGGFEYTYVWH